MTTVLSTSIIVVALLAALVSAVTAFRNRPMGVADLVALGALEVLLIVQVVVGFVKLSGDGGPEDGATFVGYLLGVLLVPLAGAAWGLLERTRWGPTVIVVAGLAVAVMVVRMNQIWDGTVG
ncbi:hypothetical protein [Actinomadura flavalba]|uniref:hypothetical protein n=1 Tax=Actinomadura flavalba TaxID=1120938 RepID=UPI000361E256|nr:hypothetical protein [Actinomadura flavalba]